MADKKKTGTTSAPRYLVAWGGDKRSQDALKLGSVLARTFGAKLDIVYVVLQQSNGFQVTAGDLTLEQEVGKQARGWLKKAAKSVDKNVAVQTHVAYDSSVTQGILAAARRLGSDAIIIGAGSGAGQPVAANAIVGGLLHASPVPVAMAPRNYRKVKFEALTKISAAIGPREGAHQVAVEAADAAARVGLPLELVSIVSLKDDKQLHVDGFDEAERVLADASKRVGKKADVTTVIGKGRSLKRAVKKLEWDDRTALIVGSSRLAQGRRTFLGSAATRMLSALPVPMIVVPRRDKKK